MSSNPWISHVQKYAKKHDITYKEAMSKAKSSYKPKNRPKKGKGVKELCEAGILSKADAKKFVLRNHPDKGGDPEVFKKFFPSIQEANKTGKYCPNLRAGKPVREEDFKQSLSTRLGNRAANLFR